MRVLEMESMPQVIEQMDAQKYLVQSLPRIDLGMHSPGEYEEEGKILIQVTCSKCGVQAVSEIESRHI